MNIDFSNLNNFVKRETLKVIKETLNSQMGDDSEERRRQKKMADTIDKRKLRAKNEAEDVDEAEEEVEEEVEEETQETGVPTPEDTAREDRTGGKGTADSPKLKTPSDEQIENPSVKSVIDKLNVLRGGKSLKDPSVKKSFTQYFNGLTHSERESLLVFLTGMAQVLAGVSTGAEAIDPGDVGLQVKGDVESSEKAKDAKIIKKKEVISTREEEAGTEAAPIVVGESQNKFLIKKVFEAYKRYA